MEKQLKKHQKKNSLPSFRLPALTRLVTPACGRFSASASGALLEHVARRAPRGPARAPSPSSGFCPPPLAATARFAPTHGLSAAVASRARDWRSIPGSVLLSCAQRRLKILLLSCSGQPGLAGISPSQAPAFSLGLIDRDDWRWKRNKKTFVRS